MRKRVSIILALLLALVISMPLSVFAAAEYDVDIPVAAELNTETDTPSDPAEGEGTDGKTEPADIPTGQGELGENEYYYITPEELETYRTQFTVISPGDLFLANLTEGGMALGSLFLPLLSPLMWFVPFGPMTITIKHTVTKGKGSEIIEKDSTKTESSFRKYPMSKEIKELLLKQKAIEQENKRKQGNQYHNSDYVFKWEDGQSFRPDYL
ncbi:MAG: hypothetical protein J5870_00565, partial [Clostridia bacterium]|nr:hypothetical protein [Clostridia bacterium]